MSNWEIIKVQDIGQLHNGRAFKPSEWSDQGLPIIRIQNLNGSQDFNYFDGNFESKHEVNYEDLLFAWSGSRGTSFGPYIWKGDRSLLNQHIFKVDLKEGIDKVFIYYMLKRLTSQIEYNAHGSAGLVHITKKELEKFELHLPPLKEQQKIAEILSSVDAAIEKTEQVIAKTEEVKKGLMQQLLTRGIDQKKFKDSPVGQIPIIWNVERLGSEAYIKARIGWKGLSSEEYTDEGPYLIAGKHILRTNILWEKCDHISMERYEESPEIMLRNDDVIMTKDGTIGRVAHIESLNDKATINGTMMLIRPLENLEGKFIYYYFQSTRFQRLIKEKVSGSSIPHIFQRDLVEFKIPVPPLNEQRKIVEILSNIDKKIEREYEVLEYISNLKKGLMQQLLTGKTRVKID